MIKTIVFLAAAAVLVVAHTIEHDHHDHDHSHEHDDDNSHKHHHEHHHENESEHAERAESQAGIAHLEGQFGDHIIKGDITFAMKDKNTMIISGTITGMPPGKYGLNIHEKGDLSNGCKSTLGHFNPHGHPHGHPDDKDRHVGDLGNVVFDESRVAHVEITDRLVKHWGVEGVIGRALVLSSNEDDHGKTEHPSSLVDGNTGDRVACGVIGVK